VNAIWEGSGNVMCLDVLRAIVREPDALPALLAELKSTRGALAALDGAVTRIETELLQPAEAERCARRLVEALALALQASLLVRHAPSAVSDAFVAGRIAERGAAFGTLAPGIDMTALLQRARSA
jgi:putative acyl-CoA dehydrogenase